MQLIPSTWWVHLEVAASVFTLGSGIAFLIYQVGQVKLQVDTMWTWFTNHGSHITGYEPKPKKKSKWL